MPDNKNNEIIPKDKQVVPMEKIIDNVIQVKTTATQLTPSPKIVEIAKSAKAAHEKIQLIIKDFDPEKADEDEISELREDTKAPRDMYRNIKKSITNTKNYLKENAVDGPIKQLIDFFNTYDLEELANDDIELRRLDREVKNARKNKRWQEIHVFFNDNLKMFPELEKYVPALTDFDSFRVKNDNLVTANKAVKIGDKHQAMINQGFEKIHQDVQVILNLKSPFQKKLFELYQENPQISLIINQNTKMIEDDKKRKAEEKARIEKRAQQLAAEKIAQQKKAEEAKNKVAKAADKIVKKESDNNSFAWYGQLLKTKKYHDLSNNLNKYLAISDIIKAVQVHDPNYHLKSADQAIELIKMIIG